MCSVSRIIDYAKQFDLDYWDDKKYYKLIDVIAAAEEFDEEMGLAACSDKYGYIDNIFKYLYDNNKLPLINNLKSRGLI